MALQVIPIVLLSVILSYPPSTTAIIGSFLHCFQSHTDNTTSPILHTSNTNSYKTIFLSNAQNKRTVYSSTSHKPLLIITPTTPSDVQVAVLCGRRHGLRIRTRSGGHDYEGLSFVSIYSDPFVVIDLRNLQSIAVDVDDNTAWVGAGATLGELYYRIAKATPIRGFPGGLCPTLGLGGHLSGGGIGTMMRKYGSAVDNVIDVVLVDAKGDLLNRATMGEDLFWAIRGGGAASFGIVLSYKIKLVPVPPLVTVFGVWRNLKQNVTRILSKWEQIVSNLIEDLFIKTLAMVVNDGRSGRTIGVYFQCLFLGREGELLAYMAKVFPELGVKESDLMELSWIDSVKFFSNLMDSPTEVLLDRTPLYNGSFKAKSDFVQEPIGEKGWERIWELLLEAEGEPVGLIMDPMGGMMDRISESATPFPHRKGNLYIIQYFVRWLGRDVAVAKRHLEWMKGLYEKMAPYVSKDPRGAYMSYKDIDLGRNVEGSPASGEVWGRKYFKGNFERLVKVKCMTDRDDFFWSEQSIPLICGW